MVVLLPFNVAEAPFPVRVANSVELAAVPFTFVIAHVYSGVAVPVLNVGDAVKVEVPVAEIASEPASSTLCNTGVVTGASAASTVTVRVLLFTPSTLTETSTGPTAMPFKLTVFSSVVTVESELSLI